MGKEMTNINIETKKSSKRNLKKIFRNTWLFSMLAFVVTVIIWFSLSIISKGSQSINNIFLVVFGIIGSVGVIAFLIWISILIFSNKFSRIVTILLGIFVSSLYALTVYSIAYIYLYSRVAQDSSQGLWADNFALLTFGIVLFIWLKTKPLFVKAIITIAFVAFYFLGRNYAIKAYEPYKQAVGLVSQATSTEGTAWTNEKDTNKYLEGERKSVMLYEQASVLIKNDVFRSGPRNFFNSLYQVNKDVLNYDEQALTGKLVLTKEDAEKTVSELVKKRGAVWSTRFSLPFWVDFFKIK